MSEPAPTAAPPFVGRQTERFAILGAFDEVRTGGSARGLALLAEPGAGKSRLLTELLARIEADPEPIVVLRLWASAEARREPFHLLGHAVRQSAGIRDTDRADAARALLLAWTHRRFGEEAAEEAAHFVGELVGLPYADSRWGGILRGDPEEVQRRAFTFLRNDVLGLARQRPFLIAVEEAHRADAPSLAFFTGLVAAAGDAALLVVFTGRPELGDRVPDPPGWDTLVLGPLEPSALAAWMGTSEADPLVRLSSGSPLLALELRRTLAETGVLPAAPAVLLDVIGGRLGRLAPAPRLALGLAAVVGRVCWREALEDLAREAGPFFPGVLPVEGVPEAWEALLAGGWFVAADSSFPGCTAASFAHDLYREVALQGLPGRVRARLHVAVAGWLQERIGDRDREWLATLGTHLEAGDVPHRAAELYLRAARAAQRIHSPREALQLFARALAVGGLAARLRAGIRLEAARLRERIGEWDRAHRDLARAMDEGREAGAADIVAECLTVDARVTLLEGHFQRAGSLARRALTTARQAGAARIEAAALSALADVAARTGEAAEAAELRSKALALYVDLGDRVGEANALLGLGQSRLTSGDREGATVAYRRAADLAREQGDFAGTAAALHGLAYLAHHAGHYRAAIAVYEESLELRRAAADRPRMAWNLHNLSHIHRALGDYDTALAHHREEIALSRAVGNRPGVGYGLFNQGTLEEHTGDLEAAERSQRESLAVFREVGERPQIAAQNVRLASLAHARGDRTQALALLDEALALGLDGEELDEALRRRGLVELDHGTLAAAEAALAALAAHQQQVEAPLASRAWLALLEARLRAAEGAPDAVEAVDRAVALARAGEDVRPRMWAEALAAELHRDRGAEALLDAATTVARTGSMRLRSRAALHLGRALLDASPTPPQARAFLALRPPVGDAAVAEAWEALVSRLRPLMEEGS